MASGIRHNAYQVAERMEARGPRVEAAAKAELDVQGQMLTRVMRTKAPKFQTLLTNSIRMDTPSPFQRVIAPGVDYAPYQERGIAPGGRGLPRFNDPAAGPILAWLQSKAFAGQRTPRKGSRKAVLRNLELRDRYEGLAWAIRHKGTKASPFVKPTFTEQSRNVGEALRRAVAKGLAADTAAGTSV
nr:hypothetical protein [uncultured Albidiferax sp.]